MSFAIKSQFFFILLEDGYSALFTLEASSQATVLKGASTCSKEIHLAWRTLASLISTFVERKLVDDLLGSISSHSAKSNKYSELSDVLMAREIF